MFETVIYTDIVTAFVIDLAVLICCTLILLRYGRLTHSHPATIYLVFHILVVTSRLLAVLNGAPTLFSEWQMFEGVTHDELSRAAFLADVTLIIMTLAWMLASVVDKRRYNKESSRHQNQQVTLSSRFIWLVAAIAFPIGIVGLFLLGNLPGLPKPEIEWGEWQESSWLIITMTWAGLALLALIYWYGFRWWLLSPMLVYLLLMSVQGYHRFRVVIPLLLLVQIYLDRRGRRWPQPWMLVGFLALILIFFPLKTIGKMTQTGASFTEIKDTSSEIMADAMAGQAGDQIMLDALASSLTLIDRSQTLYYGSPYLALLVSPIPRQWWPDKPGLADYEKEFETPFRPMAEMGMAITFIGEFYLNFGYPGIVIMSFVSAYWLARVHFVAYRSNYFSVRRFGYLLVACNLIQVYRDGLMSLFVFTVVYMMPLAVIVILHYVVPRPRRAHAHIKLRHPNLKIT